MTATIVLDVIDALVAEYRSALSNVAVYDGTGITEEPGDFVMVGVGDPDSNQPPTSADTSQDWAGLGAHRRDEEGTVTCCAVSWNGESEGLGQARDRVRSMLDAIGDIHRANPTLGVAPVMWTGFGARVTLTQIQADDGSSVIAYFEIQFKARI
jgi:hypothetical protein